MTKVLDQGYVRLVEAWGSDESIIESARISTGRSFLGWGGRECRKCDWKEVGSGATHCPRCNEVAFLASGDEKLLKHLWDNQHSSPFEFAGMIIEVKAPIMVFREWHRHRTQSFSEVSARYVPLPDENYVPTLDRVMVGNIATANKQAQGSGKQIDPDAAAAWLAELSEENVRVQALYEKGLALGIPKELARLPVPVARYSKMRASALLLNWFKFLKLRCATTAQYEIRVCANEVAALIKTRFPRTYDVAKASLGLPE